MAITKALSRLLIRQGAQISLKADREETVDLKTMQLYSTRMTEVMFRVIITVLCMQLKKLETLSSRQPYSIKGRP